jgi:hypothetical protein
VHYNFLLLHLGANARRIGLSGFRQEADFEVVISLPFG